VIKRATVLAMLLSVVAAATASVAPALASASFTFSGRTSQGAPVKFRVSGRIALVNRFEIAWKADCTSGASIGDSTVVSQTPVHPFPRFHNSGSYMAPSAIYTAANGRTLSYSVSAHLRGILPRNAHAHGTWTAQVQVLDTNRNVIDTCTTGLVHWHATLS
jgi:hypothetical protein